MIITLTMSNNMSTDDGRPDMYLFVITVIVSYVTMEIV
jgi:hypothetical protein